MTAAGTRAVPVAVANSDGETQPLPSSRSTAGKATIYLAKHELQGGTCLDDPLRFFTAKEIPSGDALPNAVISPLGFNGKTLTRKMPAGAVLLAGDVGEVYPQNVVTAPENMKMLSIHLRGEFPSGVVAGCRVDLLFVEEVRCQEPFSPL